MNEFNYYCVGDMQQYAANCCSWCGAPDAKDLEGCDGVKLCETCRKDLEDMEEEFGLRSSNG